MAKEKHHKKDPLEVQDYDLTHDELLTVSEIAGLLEISKYEVYQVVRNSKIPSCRVGAEERLYRKSLLVNLFDNLDG